MIFDKNIFLGHPNSCLHTLKFGVSLFWQPLARVKLCESLAWNTYSWNVYAICTNTTVKMNVIDPIHVYVFEWYIHMRLNGHMAWTIHIYSLRYSSIHKPFRWWHFTGNRETCRPYSFYFAHVFVIFHHFNGNDWNEIPNNILKRHHRKDLFGATTISITCE